MEHRTETLPGGTLVLTDATHKISSDALLLGRFCEFRPEFSACDLGSGCGTILLTLADRGLAGRMVGVEQNTEAVALLAEAARRGALHHLEAVHGDVRLFTSGRPFDIVVANPPYFTQGKRSPNPARAAARHGGDGTLADFCAAAARLLKHRGRFCVCYPAGQLAGLFAALCAHTLAPKRLQLVRKAAADEPWLALVEARKAGGEGLHILPDLLLPPGQALEY